MNPLKIIALVRKNYFEYILTFCWLILSSLLISLYATPKLIFFNLLAVLLLIKFQPELSKDFRRMSAMAGLSLFFFTVGYLVKAQPIYLSITAIVMILVFIFQEPVTVFLMSFYCSFFAAAILNYSFNEFTLLIFNALFTIYFTRKLRERTDLLKASAWTALGTTAIYWNLYGGLPLKDFISSTLIIFLLCIASAIIILGILPYLETIFHIITPLRLLELSSPSHPLLKRLIREAPGTYHHSLMVANLAEAAAEAINCDSLLARVAAYYHDIGKINRPYFFIENQTALENPHDLLNPRMSAMIIQAHTKEGRELGKKHHLPTPILDIIEQHHGTNIIAYFYKAYLEKQKDTPDNEKLSADDFRYSGPKPQSKEAGIMSLADSCEAAVRSLDKATPTKITTIINKIFAEKQASGELDACDFTMRDISTIRQSFINLLSGLHHARIKYVKN